MCRTVPSRLGVLVGAALATLSAPSLAADEATAPAPASTPWIGDDLRSYYAGEQRAAYIVGAIGAAAAAGGGYLVTRDSDFARGLGWPWMIVGGLELLGALGYSLQVRGETEHYESRLASDPAAYRAEESNHLRGTASRFIVYRAVELSLTLAGAGLAAYGLATNRDAWKGAGIGVFSLAAPVFVIDTFNNARASRYLRAVESFQATIGLRPEVGDPTRGFSAKPIGWTATLEGRF